MKIIAPFILGFLTWKLSEATYATWHLFGNLNPDSIPGIMTLSLGFVTFMAGCMTFLGIIQMFVKRNLFAQHVVIEKEVAK